MKHRKFYTRTTSHLLQKSTVLIYILFFICACKKGHVIDYNKKPENIQEIFRQFCDKMNSQYVYWDKENTDWDVLCMRYKPLFDNLSNSVEDKKKAASYFKEMTSNLIDNHLQITFNEGELANVSINPGFERKRKAENYHERFNYVYVVKSYLDNGYISGNANISEKGIPLSATTGTINHELLYFHCNYFALKQAFDMNGQNKVKEALSYFFSQLNNTSKPIKGIILDLRNNYGGNIVDLNFFAGKLITSDHIFGYTRSKSGLGKYGYLPWLESKLKHDNNYHVNVPVILLGDNYSASLAEIMIISLKSQRNLFIGEQTYGATGAISDPSIFNAGSFDIGSFLSVKTSSVEFKGINGTFYENIGIIPSRPVPFNPEGLYKGKDIQLELAIGQFQ